MILARTGLADLAVHHRLALLVAGERRNADEMRERDESADVIALHEQSAAVDAGHREFGDAVAFVELARRRPIVGGLVAFIGSGFLRRRAPLAEFLRQDGRPPGFAGLIGRRRVARVAWIPADAARAERKAARAARRERASRRGARAGANSA